MNEVEAHIALQITPGIGRITHRRLVEVFGSAGAVWSCSGGGKYPFKLSEKVIRALERGPDRNRVESILEAIDGVSGWVMVVGDPFYPELLEKIYDPPQVIYGKGSKEILTLDSVALVGARKSTSYGRQAAKYIAEGLALKGITVISGLALGVDAASHSAALSAGGVTVAVKGCGIDVAYPRANSGLAASIVEHGAVISEFPPGTEPEPRNFPIRNRIISGLSLGVVVVEAARKSGSLITASMALDQGREVMAVPGSILGSHNSGSHWLLSQGAGLVTSADDVFKILACGFTPEGNVNNKNSGTQQEGNESWQDCSEDEKAVLSVLSGFPIHIDEVAACSGIPLPDLATIMVRLELADLIQAMPGQMYCLAGR